MVSKPQNRPTRHLHPRTSGHLVEPEGSTARARLGPTVGPPWSPGRKFFFFKVVPRPLGMLKQVFLSRFEPVVARFGPWKIPKCLENGPFQDQKWVKNALKTRFSKSDLGPFGLLKQMFVAHFKPNLTQFSDTVKSSHTCGVATVSLRLGVLPRFGGYFRPKMAFFFFAQSCADLGGHLPTWRPRPGPPPVSFFFWLKTWIWQGHHLGSRMAKVESSPRRWEGAMAKTEW